MNVERLGGHKQFPLHLFETAEFVAERPVDGRSARSQRQVGHSFTSTKTLCLLFGHHIMMNKINFSTSIRSDTGANTISITSHVYLCVKQFFKTSEAVFRSSNPLWATTGPSELFSKQSSAKPCWDPGPGCFCSLFTRKLQSCPFVSPRQAADALLKELWVEHQAENSVTQTS